MKFLASANCPSCDWDLQVSIEVEGSLEESIRESNAVIDPMLLDHVKEHSAISEFLLEAGAVPDHTTNNFRGSFNLKYQEVLDA